MAQALQRWRRKVGGQGRASAEVKKNDAALVTSFAERLKTHRRQTVLEFAELYDVTVGRAHSIMINELKMRRVIK